MMCAVFAVGQRAMQGKLLQSAASAAFFAYSGSCHGNKLV
jgi:hypothetical protein